MSAGGRPDPSLGPAVASPAVTPTRSRATPDVVDVPAVLRGAAVAVAICLPLALIGQQLVDEGDGSPLTGLLFVGVLVGFAVGGFVAARAASTAPYTNGGLAALLAFVVIQGSAVVVRLVAGDSISAPVLVFNGLLAFGCGLAGGTIASRTAHRPQRGNG